MTIERYWEYILKLFHEVPLYIYLILICMFCICSVVIARCKVKDTVLSIVRLILVEYIVLIYSTTFMFRQIRETRMLRLDPFWSYKVPSLMPENVMNVVVFIVLGILITVSFKQFSWRMTVLLGFSISISIELLQYIFRKGSFDIDDLISNTGGALIGAMICLSITRRVLDINTCDRKPRTKSHKMRQS